MNRTMIDLVKESKCKCKCKANRDHWKARALDCYALLKAVASNLHIKARILEHTDIGMSSSCDDLAVIILSYLRKIERLDEKGNVK